MLVFFFFFQAEDGIRDVAVTGVQTCALPISSRSPLSLRGKQKTRQIALYSCISTWPHSHGGVERRPLGRVCRLNRSSRRMCHQLLLDFKKPVDPADNSSRPVLHHPMLAFLRCHMPA